MCFDRKHRRLLTASNDASVRLWNFNNGSLLRRWGGVGWCGGVVGLCVSPAGGAAGGTMCGTA